MNEIKKNAVVTGATGMLGLALMRKLTAEGWHIYAVVRPDSLRESNIPQIDNITIIKCSLDNFCSLGNMISEQCDAFYHFAWDGTYGESRDDMTVQTLNIQGAVDAAKAAVQLGCKVFIGAGSQAEYGRANKPLSPNTAVHPETGYGAAKLCAGQMTRIICAKNHMKHIWCRIFSTYGPYDGSHTLVMSMIYKLLSGQEPACTKGEQIWDYLYCDDAALAFYLAAEKGHDGSVYCIGSGSPVALKDHIASIRDAVDPNIEIGFGKIPYYSKQVMYLCADITSLKKDTGFEPQTSFAEGIQKTIMWARENISDKN